MIRSTELQTMSLRESGDWLGLFTHASICLLGGRKKPTEHLLFPLLLFNKTPDKRNSKKGGGEGVHITRVGKMWLQGPEETSHVASMLRKQRQMNAGTQPTFFLFRIEPQPMKWYWPVSGAGVFLPGEAQSRKFLEDMSRGLSHK